MQPLKGTTLQPAGRRRRQGSESRQRAEVACATRFCGEELIPLIVFAKAGIIGCVEGGDITEGYMGSMNSIESAKGALSRRHVMAASLAPLIVPRHVLGGPGYQAPSDTLTIAAVGIGGMGRNYLAGCHTEKIVAVACLFRGAPTPGALRDLRLPLDPLPRYQQGSSHAWEYPP
jgi:hypothetical protein